MSDLPVNRPETAASATDIDAEHGTSLVRSVSANWLWYLLVMLSGFLIPPMVDRHLGRKMLGIWDFGWSLVFYVHWLQLGVASAINRYVARHRATRDWEGLSKTVNSCLLMLLTSCALGAAVVVVLAQITPRLLPRLDPAMIVTAQWVVLLLGATTLLEMSSSALNSVISGFERFDILNLIRGTRDALTLGIIIFVLIGGGGLVAMAIVMLITEALQVLAYVLAGKWLCPRLKYSFRYCRWDVMKDTFRFGVKTVAQGLTRGVMFEINSLLIVWFLGPAVLAIYSRQRSLVLSLFSFVRHYAFVLIPRSSHLDARGDDRGLQQLLIDCSKYGLYIALPPILGLAIMGRPLLEVWMGKDYAAPLVLATFALGNLLVIAQIGTYSILMGMGRHGWPVVYGAAGAICSATLGYLSLKLGAGMLGPALAISIAMLISDGILQPYYACRQVKLNYGRYLAGMLPGPFLACIPFAGCLLVARLFIHGSPWVTLLAGAGSGGVLLVAVYWLWVVPQPLRQRVHARLRMARSVERRPEGRILPSREPASHIARTGGEMRL